MNQQFHINGIQILPMGGMTVEEAAYEALLLKRLTKCQEVTVLHNNRRYTVDVLIKETK